MSSTAMQRFSSIHLKNLNHGDIYSDREGSVRKRMLFLEEFHLHSNSVILIGTKRLSLGRAGIFLVGDLEIHLRLPCKPLPNFMMKVHQTRPHSMARLSLTHANITSLAHAYVTCTCKSFHYVTCTCTHLLGGVGGVGGMITYLDLHT